MNRLSTGDSLGVALLFFLLAFEIAGIFSNMLVYTNVKEDASHAAALDGDNADGDYRLETAFCLYDAYRAVVNATRSGAAPGFARNRVTNVPSVKSFKTRSDNNARFANSDSLPALCRCFMTSHTNAAPLFLLLLSLRD